MKNNINSKILEFIVRRFHKKDNWVNGNCYHFAVILNNVFELPIYYLYAEGHFVVYDKESNVYYDWLGAHKGCEPMIKLEDIKEGDPLWYSHLMRDCKY